MLSVGNIGFLWQLNRSVWFKVSSQITEVNVHRINARNHNFVKHTDCSPVGISCSLTNLGENVVDQL